MRDEQYHKRQVEYDQKKKRSLNKARNRGNVAEEWFNKGNKLTNETQSEFNALMKKADKEWESLKQKR